MNRPFGAVDVSSNLKGAVPKTATQKVLLALAEKGEITQKTYGQRFRGYTTAYIHFFLGKSAFFVYNQSKIEDLPAEKLAILETQLKEVEEENKLLTVEVKTILAGVQFREVLVPWNAQPHLELAKIKSTPTDTELEERVAQSEEKVCISQSCPHLHHLFIPTRIKVARTLQYLEPLRAGSSIVSASELVQLDEDWKRWRHEWVRRKKVFNMYHFIQNFPGCKYMLTPHRLRDTALEAMTPKDAVELLDDLGVELDSPEHDQLGRSYLCTCPSRPRS